MAPPRFVKVGRKVIDMDAVHLESPTKESHGGKRLTECGVKINEVESTGSRYWVTCPHCKGAK